MPRQEQDHAYMIGRSQLRLFNDDTVRKRKLLTMPEGTLNLDGTGPHYFSIAAHRAHQHLKCENGIPPPRRHFCFQERCAPPPEA